MSLDEVIVGIRQSVRNGITKEQAELCVRLAGEQGSDTSKQVVEGLGGKVTKEVGQKEKGKGGLLASWGQNGMPGGVGGRKDEKGWVEVVECGGVKAVVFK